MKILCAAEDRDRLDVADLQVLEVVPADTPIHGEFHLSFSGDCLRLCRGMEAGCAVSVAELQRRSTQATELVRACFGRTNAIGRSVLDPFAGWGVDALTLAARGAMVSCSDVEPALCALLRDLARRFGGDLSVGVECTPADARLASASSEFDVVYLDPMFPPQKKSALPSKRLQYLAQLCPPAEPDLELVLPAARRIARKRVVLKRRRRDPVLGEPAWQIDGTTVRYDVYRPTGEPL